jgi:hypothetical protein
VTDGTVPEEVLSDGVLRDDVFTDGNPGSGAACPAGGRDDSTPRDRAAIPNPLRNLPPIPTLTPPGGETCANLS